MTPNFFPGVTLKKIWVEPTLKKSQVAPYKNLGRFYKVPFKSLFKVQIKRANILYFSHFYANQLFIVQTLQSTETIVLDLICN